MDSDAALFDFDGLLLSAVALAGVVVDVVVSVDDKEVDRRMKHGLRAVEDGDLLEALGQLPYGWGVPVADLDPVVRAYIEGAPPGLVDREDGVLMRRYRPAARATGVMAKGPKWQEGIEVISRFAAVAPRGLVLTCRPANVDDAMAAAVRFGIGLAVRQSNAGPGRLLVPPRQRFRRPGTAEWLFSERVYAEWSRRCVRQAS